MIGTVSGSPAGKVMVVVPCCPVPDTMTAEVAMQLGRALAYLIRNGNHRHRVVIGKDTRLSGYMMESALVAGFASVGMDVVLLGPMPTPAVAMLTRSMRADLGVMISASHNPMPDNGIKFLARGGHKLDDDIEILIESRLEEPWARPTGAEVGRIGDVGDCLGDPSFSPNLHDGEEHNYRGN